PRLPGERMLLPAAPPRQDGFGRWQAGQVAPLGVGDFWLGACQPARDSALLVSLVPKLSLDPKLGLGSRCSVELFGQGVSGDSKGLYRLSGPPAARPGGSYTGWKLFLARQGSAVLGDAERAVR